MRLWVWLVIICLFLGFCVFCYNHRTDHNVDSLNTTVDGQKEAIAILYYALSITPEDTRNEVFFNSIKEKFPHVENHTNLLDVLKLGKKEDEEKKADGLGKPEKTQVAQANN